MEELIRFLSPLTPLSSIRQRSDTIISQLQRPCHSDSVEDSETLWNTVSCNLCGNRDPGNFVVDQAQGITICMGPDSMGCGNVIHENMYGELQYNSDEGMCSERHENDMDLYSANTQFQSQLIHGNNRTQRLNRYVEANLSRFGKDETVTSDAYKDNQRREAYAILDQVKVHTSVSHEHVDRVKVLFHQYRKRMYRIHKLEIALLALFHMVL